MERMASDRRLDDLSQTTVYIPYSDPDEEEVESSYSPCPDRDLPGGYELRFGLYKKAWIKCLTRIQEISHGIHSPLASNIVAQIREAYTNVLPGLPYTELPVFAISGQSGDSPILQSVVAQLENENADNDVTPARVAHLYPADCTNIMLIMKFMIQGFVSTSPEGNAKRRTTTSLAAYDIELLRAWYTYDVAEQEGMQLVVLMHDFEQFEPRVVQDLFYICSLYIPQLPLVFVLALSSPPEPSYLHSAYQRATLALLRIHKITVTSQVEVVEQLLSKTFFDPAFDPGIMLGPVALDFLHDHFTRHNRSLDVVATIIQLAFMKHVDEPLTIFLFDNNLDSTDEKSALRRLTKPEYFPFLEYLFTRVLSSQTNQQQSRWKSDRNNLSSLLAVINDCRVRFREQCRKFRIGFGLLLRVRKFVLDLGYKGVESEEDGKSILDAMSRGLRGRLTRDWKYLGLVIKKLDRDQLSGLLDTLEWFFADLPDGVFEEEEKDRKWVELKRTASLDLGQAGSDREGQALKTLASEVGEWFVEYSAERLTRRLDETRLWDIWYTGSTPFPSELINPAPRAHIISALLHPESYAAQNPHPVVASDSDAEGEIPAVWELPDTSILFRGYLEAGRMINVFDWYQSFAAVLETQRQKESEIGGQEQAGGSSLEGVVRERKQSDDDEVMEENKEEEEDEKWGMEVQARFIRGVHELDFMGFLKHTGRKPDHVARTVFDVSE